MFSFVFFVSVVSMVIYFSSNTFKNYTKDAKDTKGSKGTI
jgi:hypothetical protein